MTIVLDNCNLTVQKRREWVLASHEARMWCVFFDTAAEECKYRVQRRPNHPTIPSGPSGIKIVDAMDKQLEPPTQSEGFEKLFHIRSEGEAIALLSDFRVPSHCISIAPLLKTADESACEIVKFPKIPHAINLGAATRDDKLCSAEDLRVIFDKSRPGRKLYVEEKIDGANMGIFIDDSGRIVAQNRSHFICSSYHPQFAPLDKWIAKHSEELWEILEPNRHILYGEWVYARHSVGYSELPDWFIAYDIYDKHEKIFVSRDILLEKLSQTSISLVPLVYEGELRDMDHLRAMVNGKSAFSDGRREGLVVRICDESKLVARVKLVREDFIAGNERWNRSEKLETNSKKI